MSWIFHSRKVVKIIVLSSKINVKVVFVHVGCSQNVFSFLNDVGGSNRACCLVGMRLTVISLKHLHFCVFFHTP